ncbi:transmembrane amino acid transporter protein-domain-containing protein [Sporodiniella umbellata]|nr:transmembrane amino acid transporter protein-domain-containing protein [Sporodiniella umbellata]
MSSPLPVNAKRGEDEDGYLSERNIAGSFDHSSSTARLGTSIHSYLGTSPGKNIRNYGTHERPRSNYGDGADALEDEEVAKAVKRHLAGSTPSGPYLRPPSIHPSQHSEDDEEETRSVHQLPGGAITHDIYKWTEQIEQDRLARTKRSRSFVVPRHEPSDPALVNLKDPGGFRRHFVIKTAAKKGRKPPSWITHTFVDFLALYGHFGGEDLSDEENEDDDDLEEDDEDDEELGERESLLRQARANAVQGTATPAKAVFLLLKSFIGTGVMFLPKAYYNGGLLFSTLFLSFVAAVSLYCFLLLVETRNKIPASFGDIGGILYGPTMRMLVLVAITTSQIGFVCAYMVFVAQSLQAMVLAITHCKTDIPLQYLILGQVAIYVPLAMVRKIQKLSFCALIADAFILIGLVYLYYYDFLTLAVHGVGNVEWVINPSSFPMFIGTAVFTFEGVGLIIPITESMKDPKKFPKVLSWTMLFITALFISVGFLSYMAFGDKVQTVILLNLPVNHLVNTIQGLYAIAICLSIPLQLFPAIRIVETSLFSKSGKHNPIVKWQKNMVRLASVFLCAAVAIAGSADLDKFVSLIGSVFCIPLCFLFPPLFHYKGVAKTWRAKFIDWTIITFGVLCMIYTSYITIQLWTEESEPPAPISRC